MRLCNGYLTDKGLKLRRRIRILLLSINYLIMVELIKFLFAGKIRGCLSLYILTFVALLIIYIPVHIIELIIDKRDSQLYIELLTKCETACDNNDYEKAYDVLAEMRGAFWNDKNDYYSNTKRKVFEREINYLISLNTPEASNRIAYLLTENLQYASKPMSEGTYANLSKKRLDDYNKKNSSSNELCNKVFNLAASQGNKYLCKKLLFFYREEAVCRKVYTNNSKNTQNKTKNKKIIYIVSYKNSAKESAIKKYKEFFGEVPDLNQDGDITE